MPKARVESKMGKRPAEAPGTIAYRLVMVEWEDSARPISAWQWVEDYELPDIVSCVSVGYVIAETKHAIALAPNLGDIAQPRSQACGIIRIPRRAVTKIRELAVI
jgi:hypothetical protein